MADFSPADVAEVTVTVVHKVKQKLGTTEYDVPIGVDDEFFQEQNEEDDQVKIVHSHTDYGLHREREILVSRREMGDEKREIDFLHFLPNFGPF